MKHFLLAVMMILCAVSAQAADVGVSVSVGQPGFYGRIDIGNYPQPQLIYAEPIMVRPAPVGVVSQPIYVHVPPGHEKKWSRHCGNYNACGRPVYFVKDRWYNDVYVPQYQARHGKDHEGKKDKKDKKEKKDKKHKNGKHGNGQGHD